MKYNGTTVPNYRDDTYNKDEVHRKTSEELYDTAFNEDQQKVLDNFEPSGGGSLPDVTSDDNGDVLTVVDGEWEKAELDLGYSCSVAYNAIDEESVTTTDNYGSGYGYGRLQNPFTQYDVIRVTFDGEEYVVSPDFDDQSYGAPYYSSRNFDWSTYPFRIDMTMPDNTYYPLYTETAGTHSIKIEAQEDVFELSECFEKVLEMYNLKNIKDASNGGIVEGNVQGQYCLNEASGFNAHAEGGYYSETEGGICSKTVASGICSHAEGQKTEASGECSHAEGINTKASGRASHTEGEKTKASNSYSHAEGDDTTASGSGSHAEGGHTTASGGSAHAEGSDTLAEGASSHAEGYHTSAKGRRSHTEGEYTEANGESSHAEGVSTIANCKAQHVFGKYNVSDTSGSGQYDFGTYVEIVGNGTSTSARSNARTLDWNGNEELQGNLTLGKGTADETTVTAAQLKALLALLN